MPAGDSDVLDKVEVFEAGLGTYWHVYNKRYSPVASNPASEARLAWRDGSHGMFYTGATRSAALWETVLRNASVRRDDVYTDRVHLKNMVLVRLELVAIADILDLRPPYRRAIVTAPSELDEQWDQMLKDPVHKNTHDFTTRAMAQLAAAGHKDGAALRWYSRMTGSHTATLFFEPPMKPDWWTYKTEELFHLDSPEGEEQIRQALAEQGLRWLAAPVSADFVPVDGAEGTDT
ncbi:RES domain-containing protein [Caballeronia sp. SEWSISQ10-4 2]|uniref:RES domain-containing protein n=1 Tax=Caballeronia sp. SEWSISQ10-4 2 TaxID=2937438 RepID=UPI00264B5970|nr:RES domain-containing protein [Caballeronia sp. SEWSISQ10-4 2]MDN7177822.1 RES domain-containing protein [Caballeronia sp. SEWSISQ10-4 2]